MKKSITFLLSILILTPILSADSGIDNILDADYEQLETPLTPGVEFEAPIKIEAKLVYTWSLPNNTQVILAEGNFRLTSNQEEVYGANGVVWIRVIDRKKHLQQIDVYTEGNATLKDTYGAITTDSDFFITIFTTGKIELTADSLAHKEATTAPIYIKANKIRTSSSTTPDKPKNIPPHTIIVHPKKTPSTIERKLRRPVTIRGNFILGPILKETNERILIGSGGIYLIQQAETPEGQPLELYATNAVLFLKSSATPQPSKPKQTKPKSKTEIKKLIEKYPTEEEKARRISPAVKIRSNQYVSSAYLEGDVVITKGYRKVRADEVFYNFDTSEALIINAVARNVIIERNLPIYIRATEIRQLSEKQFLAKNAKISTNSFYTPSYHVGATKIYFEDRTERLPTGEQIGLVAGTYKIYNATLNVEGVPLLYWPFTAGKFKQGETALKSMSMFYDSDFGISGRTSWHLLQLLGLTEPEGVDTTLRLDYFGKRGPAVGIDVDYERDTYFGYLRSYYVHDTGEDNLGGDLRGDVEPPYKNRGRFLIRHKHFLPEGWELNLELSYISDRHFLEEYFKEEWEEEKEQETVIYLKKVFGDVAFSILGKWRINDFMTKTEELPDIALDVLGKPLFDSLVTWYSENHIGAVRRKIDHGFPNELPYYDQSYSWWLIAPTNYVTKSDVIFRADTRQEFEIPFTVGPIKIVPFVTLRGTGWDDSIEGGGLTRFFASYGVKASTYQWKIYDDVESRLWNLHRLRHIMKEDITLWAAHTNQPSEKLYAFDQGIETIDEIDGVSIGWRHRLQTKRMSSTGWQSVDWLTIDLEAGFFNDNTSYAGQNRTRGQTFTYRPEFSVSSNYVSLRTLWQVSATTSLSYQAIVDTNEGRMGRSYLGITVSRIPKLIWSVGHEYIGLTQSNLFTFTATYRINRKYLFLIDEEFDFDRGENANLEIGFVRQMPGWYIALTAGFDETEKVDSINLAIWPKGIPEWTIGLKKYPREFKPLLD